MPPEKSRKSRLTPKKKKTRGFGGGGGGGRWDDMNRDGGYTDRSPERTLHGTPNREKHLIHDFGKTKTCV